MFVFMSLSGLCRHYNTLTNSSFYYTDICSVNSLPHMYKLHIITTEQTEVNSFKKLGSLSEAKLFL